jgi:uncharacterized protein with GYD domain
VKTFVCLYRFTDRGIANIKESPARVEAVKRLAKSLGGELKQFFLVIGPYDTVVVFQAPDDETMVKINLAICSQGNVHSHTLRAFGEEEYRKLIAQLP